eukprot:gene3060-597_t
MPRAGPDRPVSVTSRGRGRGRGGAHGLAKEPCPGASPPSAANGNDKLRLSTRPAGPTPGPSRCPLKWRDDYVRNQCQTYTLCLPPMLQHCRCPAVPVDPDRAHGSIHDVWPHSSVVRSGDVQLPSWLRDVVPVPAKRRESENVGKGVPLASFQAAYCRASMLQVFTLLHPGWPPSDLDPSSVSPSSLIYQFFEDIEPDVRNIVLETGMP